MSAPDCGGSLMPSYKFARARIAGIKIPRPANRGRGVVWPGGVINIFGGSAVTNATAILKHRAAVPLRPPAAYSFASEARPARGAIPRPPSITSERSAHPPFNGERVNLKLLPVPFISGGGRKMEGEPPLVDDPFSNCPSEDVRVASLSCPATTSTAE